MWMVKRVTRDSSVSHQAVIRLPDNAPTRIASTEAIADHAACQGGCDGWAPLHRSCFVFV